jgi:glycosyltransferase involved in cell wall biosynthesis
LRILFVYSRDSSFVSIDRRLLARRWQVEDRVQARPTLNLASIAAAVRKSDLVFGWFASWHTLWPMTFAWLMRRPSVLVIGGFDTASLPEIDYGLQQRRLMRGVSRWTMRRATRLMTNSDYSRREIEANLGIPASRVEVVHHGVPDPFGELPVGAREPLALTVGVIDRRNLERKGLLRFVQAARLVPHARFVVAGRWEGDAVEELRAASSPNVTLTGWIEQDELESLYRRASVYVQASRHEGFGLSVAEAMLGGCVPVVSEAGALPEVVGDAGIVLGGDSPRPDEIAGGVRQALALDNAARERARRRILDRFPLGMRADGLERVVESALATRAGG